MNWLGMEVDRQFIGLTYLSIDTVGTNKFLIDIIKDKDLVV